MKEISFPRQIDEVVILARDLDQTLNTFRTVFRLDPWEEKTVSGEDGGALYRQAVHVMRDRKALRVVQPVAPGTIYRQFLDRCGIGLFGVRERVPDEFYDQFREHLAGKGVPLTVDGDGVLWADLTGQLGGFYGFVRQSAPAHPEEKDRLNLRQFCIVTDDVEGIARAVKDYLLLGPTEIGHSNSRTVTGAVSSQYPGGLPDFEFLAGMLFYDNMEFEIVEPKRGPLAYFDFLRRRGTGFHHIKTEVPQGQWDAALDYFYGQGLQEGLRGKIGTCGFSNLLTEDLLGFVYELSDGAPIEALPEGYDPYFYPAG